MMACWDKAEIKTYVTKYGYSLDKAVDEVCKSRTYILPLVSSEPLIYYLGEYVGRKGEEGKMTKKDNYSIYAILLTEKARKDYVKRLAVRAFTLFAKKVKEEREQMKKENVNWNKIKYWNL